MGKVFVGHDWAEAHHDVFVEDESGCRLAAARLAEGLEGVGRFHELVASHAEVPADVLVATETDRGLFVTALVAAGYEVIAVNPLSTSRYRERLSTSGAKSDPGDARVLAELARVDGHNHRRIAGDSELAEAVKVLARAHQSMIWTRQRQTNQLRSTLREFYPAALDAFPTWPDATPSPYWRSPPPRAQVGSCHAPRSLRRCVAPGDNDASTNAPSRSRPCSAASGSAPRC
jgi:transposase